MPHCQYPISIREWCISIAEKLNTRNKTEFGQSHLIHAQKSHKLYTNENTESNNGPVI